MARVLQRFESFFPRHGESRMVGKPSVQGGISPPVAPCSLPWDQAPARCEGTGDTSPVCKQDAREGIRGFSTAAIVLWQGRVDDGSGLSSAVCGHPSGAPRGGGTRAGGKLRTGVSISRLNTRLPLCGRGSMAEPHPSKVMTPVRFRSSARDRYQKQDSRLRSPQRNRMRHAAYLVHKLSL